MVTLGYKLSSEEQTAQDLITYAARAEESGFQFGTISDHFHPWIDKQGQSPFVWSVIGGISQVTHRMSIVTGVTCPTIRTHPAIIAQAAATAAALLPGRKLWEGDAVSHRGTYFTVENARIYSLPKDPPPIFVAASGEKAAQLAAFRPIICIAPSPEGAMTGRSGYANFAASA